MTDRPSTSKFTVESALAVAEDACRMAGFDPEGATLIRLGENALFRLQSDPVVVRVSRTMRYWSNVQKEVRVSTWLTSSRFPAASVIKETTQPLEVSGHPVTFWRFIEGAPAMREDVATLGRLLKRLHQLEAPLTLQLPPQDVFARIEPRIEHSAVPASDKAVLIARCHELRQVVELLDFPLNRSPVHGDAHIKNVMISPAGPVLIDFENFAAGQPEWDLSVTATEYLTAGWWTSDEYARFVEAYGFDITTWEGFEVLRSTHEIKMTTWIMQNIDQSTKIRDEYRRRIETIRSGRTVKAWSAF